MATVPGKPTDDTGGIPKSLQPTQADMLIAAALHQQDQAPTGPALSPEPRKKKK